jgi:hypothetical protein
MADELPRHQNTQPDRYRKVPTNTGTSTCTSVAEPHHYYAAPDPGTNFDARCSRALAAPAPTVLYSKPTFLKRTRVNIKVELFFFF